MLSFSLLWIKEWPLIWKKINLKLLYPKNALIVSQVKLKLAQYKVLKQDVKVKCYYINEHDNNDNEDNTYIYYGEFQ